MVIDPTGSMESIRDDTIGGLNAFLRQQKAEPGVATLTLVQFDSQDPCEVIHHFKLVSAVPELNRQTYVPRAATPRATKRKEAEEVGLCPCRPPSGVAQDRLVRSAAME